MTLFILSVFCFKNLLNILSPINKNIPPKINPIPVGMIGIIFKLLAISRAGDIKEKKLAAIITPADIPNIMSKTFLLIFLNKNTIPAPNAVIPQVNIVASSACIE